MVGEEGAVLVALGDGLEGVAAAEAGEVDVVDDLVGLAPAVEGAVAVGLGGDVTRALHRLVELRDGLVVGFDVEVAGENQRPAAGIHLGNQVLDELEPLRTGLDADVVEMRIHVEELLAAPLVLEQVFLQAGKEQNGRVWRKIRKKAIYTCRSKKTVLYYYGILIMRPEARK